MKARGVYVYGVWCPTRCGWSDEFYRTKRAAVKVQREAREYDGCSKNRVVKIYIAPPKGAAK